MKKTVKILSVLCFMIFVPMGSFALFDFNLYGGIPFAGQYDDCNQKFFAKNSVWGASGHLNTDFLGLLQLGLGGFYQKPTATYKAPGASSFGDDFTVRRTMVGIDAYAQLEIPLLPFCPYLRVNTAAWNKVEGDIDSKTENFKRHGVGVGLLFTILPVPGLARIQLFAEYDYEFGKEDGIKVRQNNLFLGVRADIL